ncbi:MAG: hypothetical protein J3Q66DRAFT_371715 [Benniella sp.]|nr:MAG: hypothetical protein J3Q66DRAFT_371715 [Benniella sp.]
MTVALIYLNSWISVPLTNSTAVYHSSSKFKSANGMKSIIYDAHDYLNQCLPVKWGDFIKKPRATGTVGLETVYPHNARQVLSRWGVDASIVDTILGDIDLLIDNSLQQQRLEFNARLYTYLPKECRDGVKSMCLSTLLIIALPRSENGTVELRYALMQTNAETKLLRGMSSHEVAMVQCVLRSFQAEWIRSTVPTIVQTWMIETSGELDASDGWDEDFTDEDDKGNPDDWPVRVQSLLSAT